MKRGFTIVELLVVIVVIAILAAITIVAYNGIQNRGNDTAVQSDLHQIGSQILQYSIVNGALPVTIPELTSLSMKVSGGAYGNPYVAAGLDYNMAYCRLSSSGKFAVIAASKSGNVFAFSVDSVKSAVGPMTTIATTCANNGFSGASTTWFYNGGTWQFGIQS
jgi:prepilin-type N-terminal cleavage/methylation domain-containing protein